MLGQNIIIGTSEGYSDGIKNAGEIEHTYHKHVSSCYCVHNIHAPLLNGIQTIDYKSTRYYFHCAVRNHYWGSTCDSSSFPEKCTKVICGKTTETIEGATIKINLDIPCH